MNRDEKNRSWSNVSQWVPIREPVPMIMTIYTVNEIVKYILYELQGYGHILSV